MTLPKIPRDRLGHCYLASFFLIMLALMFDGIGYPIFGFGLFIWTVLSDTDDSNHIDPPGTKYVNNREVRK
jgi:hypothetical protein